MYEQEDLLRAVARVRDQQLAELATLVIGLAAETHPEELRKALGKVFDLTAIETTHQRMMQTIKALQELIRNAWNEIRALEDQLKTIKAQRTAERTSGSTKSKSS